MPLQQELPGRRRMDHGTSYLSGSATVKDDLQAIYTLNQEVGGAVWTILVHLEALKDAVTVDLPSGQSDLERHLSALTTSVETIKAELPALSHKLEALEGLKNSMTNAEGMLETQEELHSNRQEHFDRIVKILYKANGFNEIGIENPEAIKKFDKWTKIAESAFWTFILTSIFSGIFYMYVKNQQETSDKRTKALTELVEMVKKGTETQEKVRKDMEQMQAEMEEQLQQKK